MSDARERIRGQIESLTEELALIRPTSWNHGRIADRRQAIILLQLQLERIERMHKTFLDYRAQLVARHHDFVSKGLR
jgi:hypothetical protein